ncbi:MAG: phosphomannomutase/phosphoglucomutase [Sedimentisphaerales bacterium]|nr:phosphomannomutase/phosphoglucomutase [Sedimentisphaerales bacterium]
MNQNFKNMFREYDIRGRVNDEELNKSSVSLIVKAFGTWLRKLDQTSNLVVIGYDNRSYSPRFSEIAKEAMVQCGFHVIDIGLSLSPVVYFAQYYCKSPAAIMITASHNPDGWCGFKLANGYSKTLGPREIKELFSVVESEEFVERGGGSCEQVDVRDAYIDSIVSRINMNANGVPRVVIEAGNGGAGIFAWEVFYRLGCPTFQLYCDPDISYPHYFPNPSDLKARTRLSEMVTHQYIHADVGIGFDGDGDRIGIIDENGQNLWSDRLLMILARQLLEKKPGGKIVFDVKCTQALPEVITEYGGEPIMWKTGHSLVKAKMHETKADLAGERSGHIFVGGEDYYGFDDAIFAAAKLVEYLSHVKKPITEILNSFPQYITSPEIKAHCPDETKYDVVDRLVADFKREYGSRVNDINGARVLFDNGWGLVRASSNLPELVLIFEGKTEQDMMHIRDIFKTKLDKYKDIDSQWENDVR